MRSRRTRPAERGYATVEFVLVLPVLAAAALLGLDLAGLVDATLGCTQAAQVGARVLDGGGGQAAALAAAQAAAPPGARVAALPETPGLVRIEVSLSVRSPPVIGWTVPEQSVTGSAVGVTGRPGR